MDVKLKIKERIVLGLSLPKQGDLETMRTVGDIQKRIAVSEVEQKAVNFQSLPNGGLTWDPMADVSVPFGFSDREARVIQGALQNLDAAKRLTVDHVSLMDKFVGAPANE